MSIMENEYYATHAFHFGDYNYQFESQNFEIGYFDGLSSFPNFKSTTSSDQWNGFPHSFCPINDAIFNTPHAPIEQPPSDKNVADVIQTLESQNRTKYSEKLVEVLKSEEELWEIKVKELNMLINHVSLSDEEIKAVKGKKKQIRKKMNKRASDYKKRELEIRSQIAKKKELEAIKISLQMEIQGIKSAIAIFNEGKGLHIKGTGESRERLPGPEN